MSCRDASGSASIRAPIGSRPRATTMSYVRIAAGTWAMGFEMKPIEAVQPDGSALPVMDHVMRCRALRPEADICAVLQKVSKGPKADTSFACLGAGLRPLRSLH